ncbi:Ldh family oxidoreductase [Pseudonocardia sp. TRM90224]|uniref:Ldh family oxidoreductase n=1 Tax=Pseudonocardia sp. TRM90224 TaxID=2812678 RepID=UPI001E42FF42|nr:Ldh family oxidoreductase [Pseudonocardia sp. TRM90224]
MSDEHTNGTGRGRLVEHADLVAFGTAALVAAGARRPDAELSAEVLAAADLAGVDSHGFARLRRYVDGLMAGTISGTAEPEVVQEHGSVAVVDAHNGLGQPALRAAVDHGVRLAKDLGCAAVAVRRSNHIGIAGWYAERAARSGVLALVTTNATPQVAPTGAAAPMFGTNPISYAVPAPDGPLVFDAATSLVPRGKLERLHREGRPMREGWAMGADGRYTTDIPALVAGLKARAGHALVPLGGLGTDFGGHKGSGLGLLVELLCGPLAGASWSRNTYGPDGADLGQFVLCLDLAAFGDPDGIIARVGALGAEITALPPGDADVPVRLPGQRRTACTAERTASGVPLLPAVVADLDRIAEQTGVRPLRPRTDVVV